MQLLQGLEQLADVARPSAVTIGKFDGIHLGHQKLLQATTDAAAQGGMQSVAITFDRHPDALFHPERAKLPLIGPNQKARLIGESGIDTLLTLAFDQSLAALNPRDFVQQILVSGLNVKCLVVGEDFRFGSGGAGDTGLLAQLGSEFGFELLVIPPVEIDGQKVSSSRIRELLDQGDVATAARLLGRAHQTTGIIEHGLKLGRQLGFPTANMARDAEGYLPVDGVYAGWLYSDGVRYEAALSVGINETIQAVPRLIEAHVLDRNDLDLYDKVVTLEYVGYLRPALKFDGLETLIAAIKKDCDEIREILRILK